MILRPLNPSEDILAARLRVRCWEQDYAGVVPAGVLTVESELRQLRDWRTRAVPLRLVLAGAFPGAAFAGYLAATAAEPHERDMEIRHLFVHPAYRRQKIALRLLDCFLTASINSPVDRIHVYNFADTPSNAFYRSLGGFQVQRFPYTVRGTACAVDQFTWTAPALQTAVHRRLL